MAQKNGQLKMTSSLLGTVLQFLDRIARTVHVDAVYCYRPSSVVCLSVGRSVTLVSPAKTAEPIEMPFGLRIRVGQGTMY